jgi:hypothetical protein
VIITIKKHEIIGLDKNVYNVKLAVNKALSLGEKDKA